jgi:hypothetical protein
MSGIQADESVAVPPSAVAAPADAFEVNGPYPPLKSWEVICAGLIFGAFCFFALYFGWYFWTGTLLI